MKTGAEYLESLRDGRVVYCGGERIDDLTTHPATAGYARVIAEYYDLHHDPRLRDELTFVDEDGERRALHWMIPRDKQDVQRRRRYHEFWWRHFAGGMFCRPPASTNCVLFGVVDDPQPWEDNSVGHGGRPLAQHIRDLWARVRAEDSFLTPMFVDVQYDRSRPDSVAESPALEIVDRTEEGIVVHGWKSVGTPPVFGNEVVFGVFWRPGTTEEQTVYGVIPANTPGLVHVARPSTAAEGASSVDRPFAGIGDELDSMAFFDHVLVPWERVLHVGNPDHAKHFPQRQFDWIHVETQIRQTVNAELLAGLALLVTEALGTAAAPVVASQLADLVRFRETCHALTLAAEETGFHTEHGMYKPNPLYVNFGRAHYLEKASAMIDLLLELCGRGVVLFPTEAELADPYLGPRLEEALRGRDIGARERLRIFKVIHERFLTEWGTRHTMFEKFNGTPLHVIKMLTMQRADYRPDGPLARLARDVVAGRDPALPTAEAAEGNDGPGAPGTPGAVERAA
ncbi:4-hydroxyphenylacetate 3-hydroxylase N-terminal domain-containing protein [Pseudonocardia sp. WMMC193]|uniref:4-hydroxyphenylacetate 3-hydroxylase N-terminal domain-containing protein n=1 Tax=Pseudonocardia sp. WMMC193 TaxID=2911965 RepID=UPI001F1A5766|nr:4-hydroxyphenylacetate 3-hydroxylase N-terminal domain-containing protein [Pseudonocardia sp. WMMC193]MCF7553280.1 2,4,6-trichlorophenol monooxygenase [Pseudonocardia sp. WMMC193]